MGPGKVLPRPDIYRHLVSYLKVLKYMESRRNLLKVQVRAFWACLPQVATSQALRAVWLIGSKRLEEATAVLAAWHLHTVNSKTIQSNHEEVRCICGDLNKLRGSFAKKNNLPLESPFVWSCWVQGRQCRQFLAVASSKNNLASREAFGRAIAQQNCKLAAKACWTKSFAWKA